VKLLDLSQVGFDLSQKAKSPYVPTRHVNLLKQKTTTDDDDDEVTQTTAMCTRES